MSRSSVRHRCREVLLTLAAVLGLVGILMVILGALFGIRPLLFRSGSMAPAIHTGDLAIARSVPAADLSPGDIVSVVNANGQRVTHRLVSSAAQGDARQLKLKGDANKSPDAEVYTATRADKVLFRIPKLGYVVSAATSRIGVFVLGVYVALLLFLILGGHRDDGAPPRPSRRQRGHRRKGDRRRRGVSLARSASVAAVVGLLGWAAPAAATPWTDAVPVSGQLTAYTVTKPSITGCTVTGGALAQKAATIVWTEISSPYALDYVAVIVETGQSLTVTDDGSTRHVTFSAGLLSTVLNATYTVRITASLPSPNGTWRSVAANQPVTIGLLGLSLTCGTAS